MVGVLFWGDIMSEMLYMLFELFMVVFIFAAPAASLAWFVRSIIGLYKRDKNDEQQYIRLKRSLIISGSVFGVMLLAIAALFIILMIGIANM